MRPKTVIYITGIPSDDDELLDEILNGLGIKEQPEVKKRKNSITIVVPGVLSDIMNIKWPRRYKGEMYVYQGDVTTHYYVRDGIVKFKRYPRERGTSFEELYQEIIRKLGKGKKK